MLNNKLSFKLNLLCVSLLLLSAIYAISANVIQINAEVLPLDNENCHCDVAANNGPPYTLPD